MVPLLGRHSANATVRKREIRYEDNAAHTITAVDGPPLGETFKERDGKI